MQELSALQQFDRVFLQILALSTENVLVKSTKAVEEVMSISMQFLNGEAQEALQDFRSLYLQPSSSSGETQSSSLSKDINSDVDQLFDSVREKLDAGSSVEAKDFQEEETLRERRLGLAAIQKRLEAIISLDEGIRQSLVPILTSMQFEDLLRHRLKHLLEGWTLIVSSMHGDTGELKSWDVLEVIERTLTSQIEKKLYYELVLKKDLPPDLAGEDSSQNLFLF